MSVSYQAVGWNRQKKIYDWTLVGGIVLYLGVFMGLTAASNPEITVETLLIRGFGTCALVLLHIILAIGPLCRLDARFLPLLYNRRHLGVTMFILALAHGAFSIIQFHAVGKLNPLVNVLAGNSRFNDLSQFPFQPLGLAALAILFLMAATSHDFWLANLSAPLWKALHMLVYVAYGLILAHVALGVLQYETRPVLVTLLLVGCVVILGLHLLAGWREAAGDRELASADDDWVDVCAVHDIRNNRAKVVTVAGERLAVFRYDGKISVLSSVCQHQNGPLGEGKVVDGLVVCPWHGYQYKPDCGASPAPFNEKIPTFAVRLEGDRVLVHPKPNAPGTSTPPAVIPETILQRSQAHG